MNDTPSEEQVYTLDEVHSLIVPDGRCPQCGRPSEATEKQVFDDLRTQAAMANERRDVAESQARELEERADQLAAELKAVQAHLKDAS